MNRGRGKTAQKSFSPIQALLPVHDHKPGRWRDPFGDRWVVTSICPAPYFSAFDKRLRSTCAMASRLPSTGMGLKPTPAEAKFGRKFVRVSRTSEFKSKTSFSYLVSPRSIRAKSSTLLIRRVRRDDSLTMISEYRFCRSASGLLANNSENIRIEVRGVFNSCETLLTKSVF